MSPRSTAPFQQKKPPLRMPAEWETHRATHLAFPANKNDWPGKFAPVRWAFVEFIRLLSRSERILLAVNNDRVDKDARRMCIDAGVDLQGLEFVETELDRGWMRDISPFWVLDRDGAVQAQNFLFNGWAKYDNHLLDQQWPRTITKRLGVPGQEARYKDRHVVLEGGAVDTNGDGALLTTEECLLDDRCQTRNPGFTRQDYEAAFKAHLGIEKVLWLGKGIAGDDTHGHIDDICRFVNPTTVVLCQEDNAKDENYHALKENAERLQNVRLPHGQSLEVIPLPMPAPLYFKDLRLPASYANFYIANNCVLVPTFNDEADRKALGILNELFPDRHVIGIHAVDLLWGFGTLHCLSHEEPAPTTVIP